MTVTISMSVEAVRNRVFNFLFNQNESYVEIISEESDELEILPSVEWDEYFHPDYLPLGYYFYSARRVNDNKTLIYSDGINQIIFNQKPISSGCHINIEDVEYTIVKINAFNGNLVVSGEETILVWNNEVNWFSISGTISKEEMLKIAESTTEY
jgi:hypothetical protein